MKELKLPKVGEYVRHQGTLITIRKTQPPLPKPITEYIFEERGARKELRFKDGTVLKVLETLNDFYGLGTGEETAIKELTKYCKKKGISKNGDIEAFVVREIKYVIKKPTNQPNFYDKIFYNFESVQFPILKEEEIDIWSSKQGAKKLKVVVKL